MQQQQQQFFINENSAKWQACPEWDFEYLMQVEDGETKNGPHPGA
ncbi:hypothetical protein T05_13178 [Trichinella murrelli]|uniref:Uncharacterized protein n=1 Tax=Trichinella murrelli TaxID=144512 RepID=A0A0V0SVB9_9BILA|nr:hypothetical protein T05_13178 [Trichinella murrelli]